MNQVDERKALDACLKRRADKSGQKVRKSRNTFDLRSKNRRKRIRQEKTALWKLDHPEAVKQHIKKWRNKFREKYNAYLRGYRARRRSQADELALNSAVHQ